MPENDSDVMASSTRRAVLELLQDAQLRPDPGVTAAEVGAALGLHVTTARFHLERMVTAGIVVTAERRGSVGRPRKIYLAAEAGTAPLASPEALQAFTELLTSAYAGAADGSPVDPEQAGRRWVEERSTAPAPPSAASAGAWLGKVGMAVDLLDEWGYRPELRTTGRGRTVELTLQECPFLTMAKAHPDVVCGIHRGLIRGTMATVGEEAAEVDLQPFVTERTCLARLTTTADFRRDALS